MEVDAEDRAYHSLSHHLRSADLAAIAKAVLCSAVEAGRMTPDPERVTRLAAQLQMSRDEAVTPFGNALEVLEHGPRNGPERALANAIAALVVAGGAPTSADTAARVATDMLWLAAHTPFDATGLLDSALGTAALPIWAAVADRILQADAGALSMLGLGEAIVGAVALSSSRAVGAAAHASRLAAEVRGRKLIYVLRGPAHARDAIAEIVGEMAPAPLGPFLTIVLAATGILLVLRAVRLLARVVLAYKMPAEVALLHEGGVRVRWRVELLGRTVRERDIMLPRTALLGAVREVRYPEIGLYAGLLALTVGSYVGVAASFDGMRATSPSLLGCGLLIIALGLALDFGLARASLGARGRCRVVFVPRSGATLCVAMVDPLRADAFVTHLDRP
jgi:hypothetical protein